MFDYQCLIPFRGFNCSDVLSFRYPQASILPEYLTQKASILHTTGITDIEAIKQDLWSGLEDRLIYFIHPL